VAFHFTLQALLRLRESFEKAAIQRLRVIAAQLVSARVDIETLDAEIQIARRRVLDATAQGITGAELRFEALGATASQERRAALVKKLREIERAHQEQQARYKEARQKREILSNLREHQFTIYQREQSRREQQGLDDLFLMRRGAKNRE